MTQNRSSIYIIGITGGVGCGKSAVVDHLKERYGAVALILDDIAKKLWLPGGPCYDEVAALFGNDVICEDGTCSRKKISERVFSDPDLMEKMNAIVHPAVRRIVDDIVLRAEEGSLIIIETAILIESGYRDLCDEIWYVYASEKTRTLRLRKNRGYNEERIRSIMDCQLSEDEFRSQCDFIIDNDGSFAKAKKIIDKRIKDEVLQYCQRKQR